ncbi:MAG: hypothetical protein AAFP77_28420 [Bacteroidota bacterium]
MKTYLLPLFALSIFCSTSGRPQDASSRLSIGIPSTKQEANSIWRTINDIQFLEGQGYQISLPEHELIDSLLAKSRKGAFGNDDFASIQQLLDESIFDPQDYQAALEKVEAQRTLIKGFIQQLAVDTPHRNWEFTFFERYEIVLTLYGTGGSYDPDNGTVTLFTTPGGAFKNYENPANTITHEIVHMGIEQPIVQKYQLPHALKERVVDRFVYVLFGEQLPNYKMQPMGDAQIDYLLKDREDFLRLGEIMEQYTAQK